MFSRFFDDFLGLEIKTVLRSNFGSFWCLCGSNFGSFWWLSGAIPTRVHSKNFAPGPYIAGVFAFFRQFFGVGDQDGTEIEFWVILVPLWIELWVILVAIWCNSSQRILHQAPISLVFLRFFRRFFEVGDQDGIEIEFWVILVPLWIEFWVILVALWCNSYSCGAFKSGKKMKNNEKHLLGGNSQVEKEVLLFNKKMSLGAPLRPLKLT